MGRRRFAESPDRFRQHTDVANHRHEIGVAGPSRDEVDVHVIDNSRARGAPEVDSDVDALRLIRLGQGDFGVPGEPA